MHRHISQDRVAYLKIHAAIVTHVNEHLFASDFISDFNSLLATGKPGIKSCRLVYKLHLHFILYCYILCVHIRIELSVITGCEKNTFGSGLGSIMLLNSEPHITRRLLGYVYHIFLWQK